MLGKVSIRVDLSVEETTRTHASPESGNQVNKGQLKYSYCTVASMLQGILASEQSPEQFLNKALPVFVPEEISAH